MPKCFALAPPQDLDRNKAIYQSKICGDIAQRRKYLVIMTYAWGLGEAFGHYMVGWESTIVARMLHPTNLSVSGRSDKSPKRHRAIASTINNTTKKPGIDIPSSKHNTISFESRLGDRFRIYPHPLLLKLNQGNVRSRHARFAVENCQRHARVSTGNTVRVKSESSGFIFIEEERI